MKRNSTRDLAAAFSAHLAAQLTSRTHRILYADSGMLTDQGFPVGLARRLLGRLLPPATDTDYLRSLIDEVFDQPDDHRQLQGDPPRRPGRAAPARPFSGSGRGA